MATAGVVIGGGIIDFLVTDSSLSTRLVFRSPTGIPITVTIRTIITGTAMAIIPTDIPLPMGTIIVTTANQLTDTTIAIVIAEGPQSLHSSANWLARATIMVLLMESWDRQRDARCAR